MDWMQLSPTRGHELTRMLKMLAATVEVASTVEVEVAATVAATVGATVEVGATKTPVSEKGLRIKTGCLL